MMMMTTMFMTAAAPSIAVEWTARLLSIWEVPGLSFYPEIAILTQNFLWFYLFPPDKLGHDIFSVYYLVIPEFDTM
jgi:hypothetical protein